MCNRAVGKPAALNLKGLRMKLKFTASGGFENYEEFSDGTVAEVTESRGKYLLGTFGAYFSVVGETKAAPAPIMNRMAKGPTSNR